jgi:hypothetical protein
MLCLSDTDIILKLAEFNLLHEALDVLHCKKKDVRVLPRVREVVSTKIGKYTRDGVSRAVKWVADIPIISDIDEQEQILLMAVLMAVRIPLGQRIVKIDSGEAILLAATKPLGQDFLIATGDKSCIRALAACPTCQAIQQRVEGRIICLEQILIRLLDAHGYAFVQEKVGRCVGDECVSRAFADGKIGHPESACRGWLDNYVAELRKDSGKLLILN